MKFQADSVEYWSQHDIETVFFGHSGKQFALTISSVPGTSDHYLEWNEQSNACTNAVKAIQLSDQELQIQLLPEAVKQLGEDGFSVEFDIPEDTFSEISRCLGIIFGDKLLVKPSAGRKKELPKKDYSGIKYLNLEGKNLRELPDYVREMHALERAVLSRNPKLDFHAVCELLADMPALKELTITCEAGVPENIGKLSSLESLSIDGFTSAQVLPESFGQLKKLKYLLLMSDHDVVLPESFAELTELSDLRMRVPGWQLPSEFYRLSALTELDLYNCRLDKLPEETAGMGAVSTVIFNSPEPRDYPQILRVLARMPNLKKLELSANPLPKEVGLCTQIEELVLWSGADSSVPMQLPEALADLQQLKSLMFQMCYFEEIPSFLGKLKSLEQLVFLETDFKTLPDSIGELSSLTFLNISENRSLQLLPESLGKLTQLKMLYLQDNPLLRRLPDACKNLRNLEQVRISERELVENIPENWNAMLTT